MPTSNEILYFSSSFVISAGTISFDSAKNKVLLIHSTSTNEFFFPKGRVNINEDWKHAAVRETLEETGALVALLGLRQRDSQTLATVSETGHDAAKTTMSRHTEPFAMTRRFRGEVEKTIYWFLAVGDSTRPLERSSTQDGEEGFVGRWMALNEAMGGITFENEKLMLRPATRIIQNIDI
ncbi:hypothetical protein MBLNU459_g1277t1 [Dothideomycetes sp. NU459]